MCASRLTTLAKPDELAFVKPDPSMVIRVPPAYEPELGSTFQICGRSLKDGAATTANPRNSHNNTQSMQQHHTQVSKAFHPQRSHQHQQLSSNCGSAGNEPSSVSAHTNAANAATMQHNAARARGKAIVGRTQCRINCGHVTLQNRMDRDQENKPQVAPSVCSLWSTVGCNDQLMGARG